MTNYKDNLPPYAEELILNEEAISLQQILNQFKQPIPTNNSDKKFVKIETDYICSTKPNWKDKPLSERYSFEYEGELFQIDIPHNIMESLELEKGEEITPPIYLDPNVLIRPETYKGITIESKAEIFLQKPFTIENLEADINKLLKKIEELETEKNSNKQTIKDLVKAKNEKSNLERETQLLVQELKGEKQMSQSQKIVYQQRVQYLQTQLTQIQNERDALPTVPTLADYLLLQTTITQSQNLLGINNLNNLPVLPVGETLISLLARPTLTQLNDLRREKEQELTTKNTQIANLTQQVNNANNRANNLQTQLATANAELDKEKDWWDKWFNYKINSYDEYDDVAFSEIKKNLSQLGAKTGHLHHELTVVGSFIYESASTSTKDILQSRKLIQAIYMYFRDR